MRSISAALPRGRSKEVTSPSIDPLPQELPVPRDEENEEDPDEEEEEEWTEPAILGQRGVPRQNPRRSRRPRQEDPNVPAHGGPGRQRSKKPRNPITTTTARPWTDFRGGALGDPRAPVLTYGFTEGDPPVRGARKGRTVPSPRELHSVVYFAFLHARSPLTVHGRSYHHVWTRALAV